MSPPRQPKPGIVIGDAEYLKAMSGAKRALYLAGFMDRVGPVKGLVLPLFFGPIYHSFGGDAPYADGVGTQANRGA